MQAEGENTSAVEAVEQCWGVAYVRWHKYENVFQLIPQVSLYLHSDHV